MKRPLLGLSSGSFYPHSRRVALCFRFARELRLDGVEIICDPDRETHDEALLKALVEKHGVPVMSLHSPFPHRVLQRWQPGAVAYIRQTVRLAERIGAAHVVAHLPERIRFRRLALGAKDFRLPCLSSHGKAVKQWIDEGGLRRLQEDTPVLICIENLPRLVDLFPPEWLIWWNTLKKWAQVHEYLTLDTTHWGTHGIEALDAYRAGGKRIRHIHLSNYGNGKQHQLPHLGELDLRVLLRQLVKDAFSGQIVVELGGQSIERNHECDQDGKMMRNIGDAIAFCRSALENR